MIFSVSDFCRYVEQDINGLIDELSSIGRVVSDSEKLAWSESYKCVSSMFANAIKKRESFGDVQISTMNLVPEYKLPAASAWCDLVLLGKGYGKNQVVIIELKNWWRNDSDGPGNHEGLIRHQGVQLLHPSDQVKGYTEYCRYFHSVIQEYNANVDGCVFFTQDINIEPYVQCPNDSLSKEYPLYNNSTISDLSDYVLERIETGDDEFAAKFVNGYYKQNRNILKQVAANFQKSNNAKPFVLLEEQRRGFNTIMSVLSDRINDGKKEVIIVEGPPGSGKSAVAINLWMEASIKYADKNDGGNIVYVTTSSAQRDNWAEIFNTYGEAYSASRLIVTANSFNPGMNGSKMKQYYLPIFAAKDQKYVSERNPNSLKFEYYEDYTNYMIENGESSNYKDNLHFLSVVDEAHALINPTANGFCSNKTAGWCFQMGPQAYHIIRESQVTVFLTDGKQSFRDNETTDVNDLELFAAKLGASVTKISLEGMQFRCAGSIEYVEWVESLFGEHPLYNYSKWGDKIHLEVVDYPSEVEDYLKAKLDGGDPSVRILSSYTKQWVSREEMTIDHSRDAEYDFVLTDKEDSLFRKYWNSGNKSFVQGGLGSAMSRNPLSEVGCPYVVRGFDYNHIGLLWLSDLVWRKGHWMINFKNANETANGSTRKQALDEQLRLKGLPKSKAQEIGLVTAVKDNAPATAKFYNAIVQAYRILMTRAIKSICIYIEDKETRDYIRSLIG